MPSRLLSRIYQLGQSVHRRSVRARRLPLPVVSVGGLSVGGAGKTPCVTWLTAALLERGWKPVILSRGYRRAGRGVEAVQPWEPAAARRYGDEPVVLARATGVPVVVGKDRWRAGMWAMENLAPQLFLLDDGFQHWRLHRDFDLVVIDATEDPDAIELLPLGRWREDLTALTRASAVLLNRCNQAEIGRVERWSAKIREAAGKGSIVYDADVVVRDLGPGPVPELEPGPWAGRKVALASAIAAPESFERSAREVGLVVLEHLRLRDHVRIAPGPLMQLMKRAAEAGAEALVVTEKDVVKLDVPPEAPLRVLVLGVDLKPRRPAAIVDLVEACVREGRTK